VADEISGNWGRPDVSTPESIPSAAASSPSHGATETVKAQIRADISDEWSWASSVARIPQITTLTITLSEPIPSARLIVSLADAEDKFGSAIVEVGELLAGSTIKPGLHVPLSARVMSQVDERRGAECLIQLVDATTGDVFGRYGEMVDVQPRDLWLWQGDPHRAEQRQRLVRRYSELTELLEQAPDRADADAIREEIGQLEAASESLASVDTGDLARCLLASFVRPNHPEVAVLAREAADRLAATTGSTAFHAFQQSDPAEAEVLVEATITAIYETLGARQIAYSEPPPGWDYSAEGQRIRDHGDVARGGLATCMDSTVLTAAVIEHVGLFPVLVLIPGHIFVGYWRRNPEMHPRPDWYPGVPLIADPAVIATLLVGRYLGLLETTTLTSAKNTSAAEARRAGSLNLSGVDPSTITLIDVLAARRASVSPLPAINHRHDGVTEVVEYRSGATQPAVEVVQRDESKPRERQVDAHPARYRTWKSSLFSLNATNDLLNLKNNPRVQPLGVPPEGLGALEDQLNRDVSFSLLSGYDIPEVWRARGVRNAFQMLQSGEDEDKQELLRQLADRNVFVQRFGMSRGELTPVPPATFVKELRSMAHAAKTAKEERGMNPLYLCLGLLRWPYKDGVFAEAPLILEPVNISIARGRKDLTIALDSSQNTTTNTALIEWLRREHGLVIASLVEPETDHAGLDIDAILSEIRKAVAKRGLPFDVTSAARLAILDLSSFRMWRDLDSNADSFLARPLVRHLVHTPTETFCDPALQSLEATAGESLAEELERLETPIPADATQKQAVLWARQGRTFVLQGPPGTGKSQTITNMVAECVIAGLRVLFVAEKGTALAVVQRRLEAIGLGPFALNLHDEGSNATMVRSQLKNALTATITSDEAAMESARRRLRNARFELAKFPEQLHARNAAGYSAYSARDELLVLGDGPTMPIPAAVVAHRAELVEDLRELLSDLQQWAGAAAVRPGHPWRLAGIGAGDPFDTDAVATAVRGVVDGTQWSRSVPGELGAALADATNPAQLTILAAACNPALPGGAELAGVLAPHWAVHAAQAVADAERSVAQWSERLRGFSADVLDLDLRGVATQLQAANASSMLGRKGRQAAATAPIASSAPIGLDLSATNATAAVAELIAVQEVAKQINDLLTSRPGLATSVPRNVFAPGALAPVRARLEELFTSAAALRDGGEWTNRAHQLAIAGMLAPHQAQITTYAAAWQSLLAALVVQADDFEAWRAGGKLAEQTEHARGAWLREADDERLVLLQRWCTLVRKLEPLRTAGLDRARSDILEGRLPAEAAEEALARGIAQASLNERIAAAGLDRFDAVAHDLRVTSYSTAQTQVRTQWVTHGPARLLEKRKAGGLGDMTGGLARELEKTTRKLSTRAILHKYGGAVQQLTPLTLCSPSSVVDLIEPGIMEFDVVIFDEASQITVPEAVGALGRARAAIVVGDTKQMPPSRKIGGGPTSDEELDDPTIDEIVEDQESILSECELARVPTLSLSWHYRSQDEALIAFSNRAYYRGDLSSFPTPTLMSSETGVEFRRVLDGHYLRAGSKSVDMGNGVVAGSNTNPEEAKAIVAAVTDLVDRSDKLPSIGVVTFNEQQRQLIENLLHVSSHPKVADVIDEAKTGRGEALFVKPLEQVQGDERDIVIFSIAFSKQANGRIPANFGPLSNSGGERRLNVAVTRARRKIIVYCSFDPTELDVAGSAFNGPKDLKEFLTFAKAGHSKGSSAGGATRQALRDRHRDEIAEAFTTVGLHVMADVGLSNFRLDLVLARADRPDRPLLPVLLDGESWMRRNTVSDRDVLPVEVLQNLMGWPAVARIWWPMWMQNRNEVVARILAEVDRVEAAMEIDAPLAGLPADAQRPGVETGAAVSTTSPPPPAPASDPVVSEPTAVPAHAPTFQLPTVPPPPFAPPAAAAPSSAPEWGPIETQSKPPNVPAPPNMLPVAEPPQSPPAAGSPEAEPAIAAVAAPDRDESAVTDDVREFVPAHSRVVGSRETLERLHEKAAAALVREQLLDIIESEGPVELGRLVRIVGRRFELNAVRVARAEAIAKLVPRERVRKSKRFGDFAWPSWLDPDTWPGFQYAGETVYRTLDEVAPEEIMNAMEAVLEAEEIVYLDDLLRKTAEQFGIARLGANVRARLEAIHKQLQREWQKAEDAAGADQPNESAENYEDLA